MFAKQGIHLTWANTVKPYTGCPAAKLLKVCYDLLRYFSKSFVLVPIVTGVFPRAVSN